MVHEDLNRVKQKPYVEQKDCTEILNIYDQEKLASEVWHDYLLRNKSVIVDLFQGQLKNTLTCKECGFSKYNFEAFMYLSLPLQDQPKNQRAKVSDCLEEFLKEEILDGDEKWYCPKCEKHVKTLKKIDLWKLPDTLMITFKRFSHKRDDKQSKKIQTCLDFQLDQFELKKFIPFQLQKQEPVYECFAALCHNGLLNAGHYTTFAQNKEDFKWYQFNDSITKTIKNPAKQIPGSQIYMLFYQKSTIQMIKRQSITSPNNWPHTHLKTDIDIK